MKITEPLTIKLRNNFVRIIFFLCVIFLLTIAAIFLFTIIKLLLKMLFEDNQIVGGIIGAIGAIIGGGMTLLGVWETLRRQKIERFIESFPQKIVKIDVIIDNLDQLSKKRYFFDESPFCIRNDVTNELNELKLTTSLIDHDTYEIIGKIIDHMKLVNSTLTENKYTSYVSVYDDGDLPVTLSDESRNNRDKLANDFKKSIVSYLAEVKLHRIQLINEYKKHTSI